MRRIIQVSSNSKRDTIILKFENLANGDQTAEEYRITDYALLEMIQESAFLAKQR